MVFTLFTVPASAAGGLVGAAKSFVEWSVNSQESAVHAFWKLIFGNGFNTATPDQLNTAYTDYVTGLPGTSYEKTGSWILYPKFKYYVSNSTVQTFSNTSKYPFSLTCTFASPVSGTRYSLYGEADIPSAGDGLYTLYCPPYTRSGRSMLLLIQLSALASDGTSSGSAQSQWASTSSTVYSGPVSSGGSRPAKYIHVYMGGEPETVSNGDTVTLSANPYVLFQPVSQEQNAPYSNDTRTGSLSGNFGYTGPDGTMITAENIKIVNETTNTLFNPVTNTTTNFKDWTYDYSTRTYDITLDTGTKQTITYGDENVTIKEGDTIYNIYYVTPDGGTPPPEPPVSCKHDYVPAVTTAATCIAPGVKTYTCSKCKDSYIEKIPATGHSWVVKETVKTTYDATGAPLTQGYTIWKCSVCGEEYKDASGAGPPGGGSSGGEVTTKEGFLSKLWGILLSFAEGLSSLFKFLFGAEGQSNLDFFNKPSTFSGVDIWA